MTERPGARVRVAWSLKPAEGRVVADSDPRVQDYIRTVRQGRAEGPVPGEIWVELDFGTAEAPVRVVFPFWEWEPIDDGGSDEECSECGLTGTCRDCRDGFAHELAEARAER